jgi:GNAT superfamily N-acetyltransferase
MYIVLSWTGESGLCDYREPGDLIYETRGDIANIDDDDDSRSLIGRFGVYYMDVDRAINEGCSVFDLFDAYSQTAEYYRALFGRDAPDFSSRVRKLVDDEIWGSNVLILDRLELLPEYRGKGLGLNLMRHLIKRFGYGAAIVAIKPFPLQFEFAPNCEGEKEWRSKLRLDAFTKSHRAGTTKLVDYYGRLGFRRVGRSPFMVLTTARPLL